MAQELPAVAGEFATGGRDDPAIAVEFPAVARDLPRPSLEARPSGQRRGLWKREKMRSSRADAVPAPEPDAFGNRKAVPVLEDVAAAGPAGRERTYVVAVLEAQYQSLGPRDAAPSALPAPATAGCAGSKGRWRHRTRREVKAWAREDAARRSEGIGQPE